MTTYADINAPIVNALYERGLELADQVRDAFHMSGDMSGDATGHAPEQDEDFTRIALSCEALRCTTRMMHAMAWLLNQRAYFLGEMSEFQLRRHGRLAQREQLADRDQLAVLPDAITQLIDETRQFYARIARLDEAWRKRFAMQPLAVERLRQRLELAVAAT